VNCEICPILASSSNGNDVVVLETTYWRVVLDEDQRFLGKSFVTLREHKESVSELSSDEWQDLHDVMRRLETSIKRAFAPSHFNWLCLMNNAVVAGQPTHVHWHMHPRYKTAVKFADETFYDTELFPPKERTTHLITRDVLLQIAQAMAS
jgi:ATP adenylyltransferase